MIDREKVLNDLQELCEYLFHEYKVCYKGDEEDTYNRFLAANNALHLLKEKSEADEVAPTIREGAEVEKVICCGSCGSSLYHLFPWKKISKAREYAQYCRHCGKKVKWDDWNGELLKESLRL